MAIEIDYFAWEKWQKAEHQDEDKTRRWDGFPTYLFLRADSSRRVAVGFVLLHLYYSYSFNRVLGTHHDWTEYSYELIADKLNGQISKLLKISHDMDADGYYEPAQLSVLENWHLYFEFVDVDALSAKKLQELIDDIPDFTARYMPLVDVSWGNVPRVWNAFQLRINNEKHQGIIQTWDWYNPFQWSVGNENAHTIEQNLKHIMLICDALTGNMEAHKPRMKQIVQELETSFIQSQLYYLPKRYHPPFPEKIESCEDWSLASWNPRKYTLKEISEYGTKDMGDCGSREDFKRFLPSLLEMLTECKETIAGEEDYDTALLRSILRNLNLAAWRTWNLEEKALIEAYFGAGWDYLLSYYPSQWLSIDKFILALIWNRHELKPYLENWSIQSEYALRHAAKLLRECFDLRKVSSTNLLRMPDSLWEWLMRDALYEALGRAYEITTTQRPYAHEFAEALEILRLIRDEAR